MRNWLLNMVKPKNARSVADLPARHKPVVMHKAAYEVDPRKHRAGADC